MNKYQILLQRIKSNNRVTPLLRNYLNTPYIKTQNELRVKDFKLIVRSIVYTSIFWGIIWVFLLFLL